MKTIESYSQEALDLLQQLIAIPSLSKNEIATGDLLTRFFMVEKDIKVERYQNNIVAFPRHFDSKKPTLWLNSHHDTVKPNQSYTLDPFTPLVKDGKLYGLGSNDAGASLVCLLETFLYFYKEEIPANLIFIASAEEEISGRNGMGSLIDKLPACDLAIVGEPTLNQAAVAEKGLMVIDAVTKGVAGHAARNEGKNAIYEALDDLNAIKHFRFKKTSALLGKSKVSATMIQAGSQHNVVPDLCTFTLDVRLTDSYTPEEALQELQSKLRAELIPRSMRLRPSALPDLHPIREVLKTLQIEEYGSPTLSDQALIPYPSIKMGPGDSARSHTADEFIHLHEIQEGLGNYIRVLKAYFEKL
ncbi:M20/M25/M40 family metallo-hydrolase [Algoriphagus namhaensis]